jgi:hypothetical protein
LKNRRVAAADELPLPRHARRVDGEPALLPLASWRTETAYVLLGDPGAGKSTSFRAEALAQGAVFVEASDIADDVASSDGLRDQVVFIDGLDQIKANGRGQGTGALGSIRKWLSRARPAAFRISCREADWLGAAERDELGRVAPDGQVTVLQLEPLTEDEALVLLRRRESEIGSAQAFWMEAEARQLTALFGNPLLLDLMVEAVAERGSWPRTRSEIYAAACERLVRETSRVHLAARPPRAGHDAELLHTAGLLCALLLLSGKSAVVLRGATSSTLALEDLPVEFELPHAAAALATKVFVAPAGQAQPRHRSIAEYLAARALARRFDEGLPLGRVLALMLGFDGKPVEALRGLLAWLAVEHLPSRSRLLRLDPLGFVLNGDPARLSPAQRLELLQALAEQAAENPWFRQDAWRSHPFGPLATADMADAYQTLLSQPQRDLGHQAFIDCVLDALCHGERMPPLAPALAAWVEDEAAFEGNRVAALRAWHRHCPAAEKARQERAWLGALMAGTLADPRARLLDEILSEAYPERLGPDEVLDYLRPQNDARLLNHYGDFWHFQVVERTRPGDVLVLIASWLRRFPRGVEEDASRELRELSGKILAKAIQEHGDAVSDAELYDWLALGLDGHGSYDPAPDSVQSVVAWLQDRPDRQLGILEHGYEVQQPDKQGRRHFWQAEQRLLGAALPPNFLRWLLDLCADTRDARLARHCFGTVAAELVFPTGRFDTPSLDELADWAEAHADAARPYAEWLTEHLFWPLEHHKGEHYRRHRESRAKHSQELHERRIGWARVLPSLCQRDPDVWLMHQIAFAVQKRFWNVLGDTPLARVQDLLGSEEATAQAALDALEGTLKRSDMPSAVEVIEFADAGRYHLIRPAALLAADSTFTVNSSGSLPWPEALSQTLIAFYLCDGLGDIPSWYRSLVRERPELVAPVYLAYARARLAVRRPLPPTGLWALGHDHDHRALLNLVLPELLGTFPARAGPLARQELERSLLAALPRLPVATAMALIARKLNDSELTPLQRLSWLVADLRYRSGAIDEVMACVARSRARRLALGVSIIRQGLLSTEALPDESRLLRLLLATLAPLTPRLADGGSGLVGAVEERERLVHSMLNRLALDTSDAARDVLRDLAASPDLHEWRGLAEYSLQSQRSAARQARFALPCPNAVALTLANKSPAHQADLRELLLDHLDTISQELRGSNSFALSQFWTDEAPRDENDCRNLLLEKLRVKLDPLGILVEPEVAAADLKRMDLKLTFTVPGRATLSLPVEAKKDSHKDLWTAWRDQLQRLYAIDPGASGYGVYLVFWFGHKTQSHPGAAEPSSAEHLRQALEAQMDDRARQQISVYVLDLAWSRRQQAA